MNAESTRQCLTDIGCSTDQADRLAELVETDRLAEAAKRLRSLRCSLMEALHACQRRVDQIDWLIRETEKKTTMEKPGWKRA